MQELLKQAYNNNYKDDALILSKAAKIIHKDQVVVILMVIASQTVCLQISKT